MDFSLPSRPKRGSSAPEPRARHETEGKAHVDLPRIPPRTVSDVVPTQLPNPPQSPAYDKLTVFQAAPLAWKGVDGEFYPLEMLDFDREREILDEALSDAEAIEAKIDVVFETATTERLGAFLATGETQVLHFSCHGHPQYLCFEDGLGGAQFLMVEDLKEFISAGRGKLHFVFVSACHSRAAGEAFIAAGVSHVVCCQQDAAIFDDATVEFARNFYRSLSCGRDLQESFDLGKQAVKLSPSVPNAEDEMRKFLLLPEGSDHAVPIFYTSKRQRSNQSRFHSVGPSWVFPPPPRPYLGREMDMYRVLQALSWARLVRVEGAPGSGKISLAAAVSCYISARSRTFFIKEIIWLPLGLPLVHTSQVDQLSSSFCELFDTLRNDSSPYNLHLDKDYRKSCRTIIETLHETKALVVIDTKDFVEGSSIQKLSIFLQDLFQGTSNVKVLLVCRYGFEISLRNRFMETVCHIGELGFEACATLFGTICPYVLERRCQKVCSPGQFSRLLVPPGHESSKIGDKGLSKRSSDILELIGEGIPLKIHTAARNMTPREYDKLMEIGERPDICAECKTRVELEEQLTRYRGELQAAIGMQDFQRAQEIQPILDELERLAESLPELQSLKNIEASLNEDLERAVSQSDFGMAAKLKEELARVQLQIKQELKAQGERRNSESVSQTSGEEVERKAASPQLSTRSELEFEIKKKEDELEEVVEARDFGKASQIQRSITQLEYKREFLPSASELSSKIETLNNELGVLVKAKDFEKAKALQQKITSLEERLKMEKDAEASLFPDNSYDTTTPTSTEQNASIPNGEDMNIPNGEDMNEPKDPVVDSFNERGDGSAASHPPSRNDTKEAVNKVEDALAREKRLQTLPSEGEGSNRSVQPGAVAVNVLESDPGYNSDERSQNTDDANERSANDLHPDVVANLPVAAFVAPAPPDDSPPPCADENLGVGEEAIQQIVRDTVSNMMVEGDVLSQPSDSHQDAIVGAAESGTLRSASSGANESNGVMGEKELFRLIGKFGICVVVVVVVVIFLTALLVFLLVKLA